MSVVTENNTEAVIVTDNAAIKVSSLIVEEDNPNIKLRVYITGGGCSGFQYGFAFTETVNDDDIVFNKSVDKSVVIKNTQSASTEPAAASLEVEDDGDDGDGGGSTTITLLIDALSYQYLQGAEIDYQKDIRGEQFIIRNPNAKTTCGCGSSFAVD